jgi:hypothetical protein
MTERGFHHLTRECRAVLRGRELDPRLAEHVDACPFCRAWLQRRVALQRALRQAPPPMSELTASELRNGIHERIVAHCEQGPIGHALAQAMSVPAPGEDGWPESLLDSEFAPQLVGRRPAPPSASEWSAVRSAVLEDIAGGAARRLRRRIMLGTAVTAAAALVISMVLVAPRDTRREPPQIVFADISALPDLPFSPMVALRKGSSR